MRLKVWIDSGFLSPPALTESAYGRRPQINIVRSPDSDMTWRHVGAALHQLAAMVEEHTRGGERWLVQVEREETSGRVYLELAEGTKEEAERGMQLLGKVYRGILGGLS